MSTIKQILISALATTQKRQLLAPFFALVPWRLVARPLIKILTEELKPADFAGQAWIIFVRQTGKPEWSPKKRLPMSLDGFLNQLIGERKSTVDVSELDRNWYPTSVFCAIGYYMLLNIIVPCLLAFSNIVLLVGYFSTRSPVYGWHAVSWRQTRVLTTLWPTKRCWRFSLLEESPFLFPFHIAKKHGDTWGISHFLPMQSGLGLDDVSLEKTDDQNWIWRKKVSV